MCLVSLANMKDSGNIKLFKQGDSLKFVYDLDGDCWKKAEKIVLSEREKEILMHSAQGLSIQQIAETIFVSVDTVKFHRRKLFEKLEVSNISEAIFFATNNKLL